MIQPRLDFCFLGAINDLVYISRGTRMEKSRCVSLVRILDFGEEYPLQDLREDILFYNGSKAVGIFTNDQRCYSPYHSDIE